MILVCAFIFQEKRAQPKKDKSSNWRGQTLNISESPQSRQIGKNWELKADKPAQKLFKKNF